MTDTPVEVKKAVAELLLSGELKPHRFLPDIHDRAGWRRWAKDQSAEAKRRAELAAKRNKVLWE